MHLLCIFHCSLRILLCKDPYNFLISQITQPLTNHEKNLECWQKPLQNCFISDKHDNMENTTNKYSSNTEADTGYKTGWSTSGNFSISFVVQCL